MEKPVSRQRKRHRAPSSSHLRCHVVDDHCDALKHIHAAIRRGSLPFTGLHMMHFDAHPDLMVTPDMPAATCFRPHDLYETLERAEGGIAEWILPLVYQGHLSKMWWVRPAWARQFADGDYRFCVGEVKATGNLRVSSTAPYFVDDRLYHAEADMHQCQQLKLCVSLIPDVGVQDDSAITREHAPRAWSLASGNAGLRADSARLGSPRKTPEESIPRHQEENDATAVPHDGERNSVSDGLRGCDADSPAKNMPKATGSEAKASTSYDQPTPWALDICLDYFTTENPFIEELEKHIGKENAALVHAFFERPLFRGSSTKLPHDVQVEHEFIFKTEVERLLAMEGGEHSTSQVSDEKVVGVSRAFIAQSVIVPAVHGTHGGGSTTLTGSVIGSTRCGKEEAKTRDEREESGELPGLQRLMSVFSNTEENRLLVAKFAVMVGCMGPKERALIAWTDHCACLPRHLANREQVLASVKSVERLLRDVTEEKGGSKGDWRGRPGVVTVARSEGDGYVPSHMVGFVEGEVLTMLARLFDTVDGDAENGRTKGTACGGRFEVVYEEGLERAQDQA